MTKQTKELPFKDWSEDLRIRWELAFAKGDFLDEDGPGAHLKPATRATWRSACGRFLRFRQLQQGEPCPMLQEICLPIGAIFAHSRALPDQSAQLKG